MSDKTKVERLFRVRRITLEEGLPPVCELVPAFPPEPTSGDEKVWKMWEESARARREEIDARTAFECRLGMEVDVGDEVLLTIEKGVSWMERELGVKPESVRIP